MEQALDRSVNLVLATLVVMLLSASAHALMPPHVTSTNIKDGVLQGTVLLIDGYSLEYTDVPKELVITNGATKKPVPFTHKHDCKWVGECHKDKEGSCQLKCALQVSLKGVKNHSRLTLRYLDEEIAFRVALKER